MRHPVGKGYFIWVLAQCEGGDPVRLADMAAAAGLSWVTFRIHGATSPYNGDINRHVLELAKVGVKSWGWGYIYGNLPEKEGDVAAARTLEFDLEGYLIDAEKEYDKPGMGPKATVFMNHLTAGLNGKPKGLCAYRFPNVHPSFPWPEFLAGSEFHAPQVYWLEDNDPNAGRDDLLLSMKQLKAKKDLPYVPIGVASPNDAGTWFPTVQQIDIFDQTAHAQNLPGVGWWSWQHAEKRPMVWDAIAKHDWLGEVPVPEEPDLASALNSISVATSEIRSKL